MPEEFDASGEAAGRDQLFKMPTSRPVTDDLKSQLRMSAADFRSANAARSSPFGISAIDSGAIRSRCSCRTAAGEFATTFVANRYAARCVRICHRVLSGFNSRRLPIRSGTPARAAPGKPNVFA